MLSWWLFLAATIAALLAVGRAAPILYAYPVVGALTAIAVIAAWASSGTAFRSGQPPGQDRLRTLCPERRPLPRPSDHGTSVN